MLWFKAFHIIAMVCWFAALFYLPRLFVYHSMAEDKLSIERFKIMERKLYRGIGTPSMIATFIFGGMLISYSPEYYLASAWFHIKLTLVLVLAAYHGLCGRMVKRFAADDNSKGHVYYRWFNEFPVLILVVVVILVVVKPTL
jgi:putative membrane protein